MPDLAQDPLFADEPTRWALVAGQRRVTPGGQIVLITRVDHERRVAWGHREIDGYKMAKGNPVPLHALEGWKLAREVTVTLRYADTPPSMNDPKSGYKQHWTVGSDTKSRWHKIFASLLLVHRKDLPPEPVPQVRCTATLIFPRRKTGGTRRDPENFRMVLAKALADALVEMRVIADDSGDQTGNGHDQFKLTDVFLRVAGPDEPNEPETIVTLTWWVP